MVSKAGRLSIAVAFVLSFIVGTSYAQSTVKPATVTSRKPGTPFERTIRPLLEQLKPSAVNGAVAGRFESAADTAGLTTPNFGGYVNTPNYQSRATNSIAYDPLNNGVQSAFSADFDKDGKPDLAVMQFDGTLNILRNNGDGTFAAPQGYLNPNPNVGSENVTQAFALDLNGDGYPDVVAFDAANSVVITWLNAGDGTFGTAQTTTLSTSYGNAAGIAVGDVNGDGKADVVVAYSTVLSRTSSKMSIQTLLGKGQGTFNAQPAVTIAVPTSLQLSYYSPIALGDLDGDGKLDIAALFEEQTSQFAGQVIVTTALGNGDGTFGTLNSNSPISASISGFPFLNFNTTGVQILDLNHDGKADIEVDMNDQLYVALGQGNGTFSPQVASTFQAGAGTIFADMNGDGYPDAISGQVNVAVWLGKGDGTFATPAINAQYVADLPTPQGLAAADFNGDKKVDIADLGALYKQVSLFAGNGDGTLHGAPQLSLPTDWFTTDTQLENVQQATTQPYSDLILLNYGGTSPALVTGLSDGKGNFSYVSSLGKAMPSDFYFVEPVKADFNGDGKQDLLMTGIAGELWVSLSNGDGTFAAPVAINIPTLACPLSYGATGDVNGDGKQDIVVAYPGDQACGGQTYASGYFVIQGNGDGTFQKPAFFPAGAQLYSATLADMNLDGNPDLILNDVPPTTVGGYQVTLQMGNGDGTFGASSTVLSNYVVSDVKVADLNQDGKPDLLLAAEEVAGSTISTGGLVWIAGNGDGTFGEQTELATGNFFSQTQVADMNGDGIADILATLYGDPAQPNTYYGFSTLLGLGGGAFSAPVNQLEPFEGLMPSVGNFYDDNAPDVATTTFYGVGLFLGQGGTTLALQTSAASLAFGGDETLTATIAASMTGRPTPTGTVSFYDGTTLLGTSSVASGSATFSVASLATGAHSITAVYSGDSNFNLNTSAASTVTVTTLTPAFTLAGTPGTLTITNGANGLVSITLAANATYSGAVNLTCSGAPANASCGFSNSSVTLAAGSTATTTLVIGTTGTQAALHGSPSLPQRSAPLVSFAALVATFCFGRRRLRLPGVLSAVLLSVLALGLVFGVTGCGGSGVTKVASVGQTSFTVTVNATPAGGAGAAQSLTVKVTVQ